MMMVVGVMGVHVTMWVSEKELLASSRVDRFIFFLAMLSFFMQRPAPMQCNPTLLSDGRSSSK